jgi:hypothetical protein
MKPQLEIEGLNIVVLGTFNPQIFQPEWYARQNLIGVEQAEKASIEFINPDISVFSIGWMRLEITRDRASFGTNQAQHFELLRDLVGSTFKILQHTPLSRFGINWVCHFRMPDIESWHKIGHKLAPKEPWAEVLQDPGMRDVMMEAKRPDKYAGKIYVTVQPSLIVQPGVYVMINDDFELGVEKGVETAPDKLIRILNSELSRSMERRTRINEKVLQL